MSYIRVLFSDSLQRKVGRTHVYFSKSIIPFPVFSLVFMHLSENLYLNMLVSLPVFLIGEESFIMEVIVRISYIMFLGETGWQCSADLLDDFGNFGLFVCLLVCLLVFVVLRHFE